jgi:hypothetical protein
VVRRQHRRRTPPLRALRSGWTLVYGEHEKKKKAERAALYTRPVPRTLIVTNDFPPRRGGIQSFVHALATRLPEDTVIVYAPAWEGAAEFDAPSQAGA